MVVIIRGILREAVELGMGFMIVNLGTILGILKMGNLKGMGLLSTMRGIFCNLLKISKFFAFLYEKKRF